MAFLWPVNFKLYVAISAHANNFLRSQKEADVRRGKNNEKL